MKAAWWSGAGIDRGMRTGLAHSSLLLIESLRQFIFKVRSADVVVSN